VIFRVIEDRLTYSDRVALERLGVGLDDLAGRRARQAHDSAR
jgi:hypothetical protein